MGFHPCLAFSLQWYSMLEPGLAQHSRFSWNGRAIIATEPEIREKKVEHAKRLNDSNSSTCLQETHADEALIKAAFREYSRSRWAVISGLLSESETDSHGLSVPIPEEEWPPFIGRRAFGLVPPFLALLWCLGGWLLPSSCGSTRRWSPSTLTTVPF